MLLVSIFVKYSVLQSQRASSTRTSSAESTQRRAEYERSYGRYEGAPQPQITATELHVEIYPDRREADVRGVHHLVNRTAQPIDTLHVAVSSRVETGDIEVGPPARAALVDDDLGHRIYVLDEPLQPGDSLRLSWQVRHDPRGFPARGISTAVGANGSFIEMPTWTPLIGYQPRRELASAGARREHGLPARPAVPSQYDLHARSDPTGKERIDLDVTVGTAADRSPSPPVELLGTWTRDGRRYFHYATAAPIGNAYAIFSADYAVREARWGDVALEILHHPAHYQELFSLFDTARDPRRIDLPFAVTAHEVAHQWWGSQGARVEGIALLSESLAWYSALGVVEHEYGTEHLARLLDFMRESYLTPRSRADVPLLRASDSFLVYRKGPFAMYALREYVGEERVDEALRGLRARYASSEPPFATSLDLYRELQEVTPDSLQYLLGDLLERNTFWRMETRQASAQQTPGGEWQVSLDVAARKVVVDTAGAETEMPMDDLVEIGLRAGDLRAALVEFATTLQAAVLAPDVIRIRRLVAAEADRFPDVAARYLADSWGSNIAALGDAIAELMARGDIHQTDPQLAAHQFTWTAVGAPLNARTIAGEAAATSREDLDRFAVVAAGVLLGPD